MHRSIKPSVCSRGKYTIFGPEVSLKYVTKALNYIICPEGTIPSIIVSGTLLKFSECIGHNMRDK